MLYFYLRVFEVVSLYVNPYLIWRAVNPGPRIFSKLGMGVELSKKKLFAKNFTFLAQAIPEIWLF